MLITKNYKNQSISQKFLNQSHIYALDNEMNLYVYNILGELLQSYDMLRF